MEITQRILPFMLPNYLKVGGTFGDSQGIDVCALFKTDEEAAQYWDEMKANWLEHIKHRRQWREDLRRAEGKTSEPGK